MDTKVINISIPDKLLIEADKIAKEEFRGRSELFREALRNYILERKNLTELYNYGAMQAKKRRITPKNLNKIISDYRENK
jgi:metal-responsive CopG/Arc/MetJ family transcriptional regulator